MKKPVIGDLRVQEVVFASGRVGSTIVCPDGAVHRFADGFLRTCSGGTDRAYACLLVDHLRWVPVFCAEVTCPCGVLAAQRGALAGPAGGRPGGGPGPATVG
jgi:hypothetical protein